MYIRLTAFWTAVAVGVIFALNACTRHEGSAADSATAMMNRTGEAVMDTLGNVPNAVAQPMTDAAIFALLSEANSGEIDAGKAAQDKGTNADVKAFARDMVTAHTKMQADGEALAKRLNIVPNPMAGDSLPHANEQMRAALSSATRGATFDTTYINGQVAAHEAVLDLIKRAKGQTQTTEVRQFLDTAQSAVEQHLDHAKKIQDALT